MVSTTRYSTATAAFYYGYIVGVSPSLHKYDRIGQSLIFILGASDRLSVHSSASGKDYRLLRYHLGPGLHPYSCLHELSRLHRPTSGVGHLRIGCLSCFCCYLRIMVGAPRAGEEDRVLLLCYRSECRFLWSRLTQVDNLFVCLRCSQCSLL